MQFGRGTTGRKVGHIGRFRVLSIAGQRGNTFSDDTAPRNRTMRTPNFAYPLMAVRSSLRGRGGYDNNTRGFGGYNPPKP